MNKDLKGFITESENDSELIDSFLKQHNIYEIDSRDEQVYKLSKLVAEISWGMGRTIEDVLVTEKVGTCTGKHRVLQACFDELNINYKPVVCTFKWGAQGVDYPENLKKILDEGEEWAHGHNFVNVELESGKWIDIDVNWDSFLSKYGFITLENWDGKSDIVAVRNIIDRWDDVEIGTMKVQLIEGLSDNQRKRRKRFLDGITEWIKSERSEFEIQKKDE